MVANHGAAEGLAAVVSGIELLFAQDPAARSLVGGIGICAPGPLDPNSGVVINPPNLPCWRDFQLAAAIQKTYGVPVKIENDANAAALAEAHWGAGRGYRHIFYTSFGTGIGSAIIFEGRIYNGRTGSAPEAGHMSIDYRGPLCGCGKPGCIEVLAAGPAIARRARAKLAEGKASSKILDAAHGDIEGVTSEMVGQAYAANDPLAKEVLEETVDLLSLWLSNVVDLLEPDAVVIGGGVAAMLSPFFARASRQNGEIFHQLAQSRSAVSQGSLWRRCWNRRWRRSMPAVSGARSCIILMSQTREFDMHLIFWQFQVKEEKKRDFVSAYGPEGDWAQLFRQAQGFEGTELLQSVTEPKPDS